MIARERYRQIDQEKYNTRHDDQLTNGQLARAAAAYALSSPACWPFHILHFKPSPGNRIKDLVKAGALIAAEIDRLLRIDRTKNQPLTREQLMFDQVYEILEDRLNKLGEISTSEAFQLCRTKVGYNATTVAFRQIMDNMIEQGKAIRIKNGRYKIIRSNARQLQTA